MKKPCKAGEIRNPETGRCVKADGPVGKKIILRQLKAIKLQKYFRGHLNRQKVKKMQPKAPLQKPKAPKTHKKPKAPKTNKKPKVEKACKPGEIRNPETGRCVKADGPIGKKILIKQQQPHAIKLQKYIRGHLNRQKVKKYAAATTIQRAARKKLKGKPKKQRKLTKRNIKIQQGLIPAKKPLRSLGPVKENPYKKVLKEIRNKKLERNLKNALNQQKNAIQYILAEQELLKMVNNQVHKNLSPTSRHLLKQMKHKKYIAGEIDAAKKKKK